MVGETRGLPAVIALGARPLSCRGKPAPTAGEPRPGPAAAFLAGLQGFDRPPAEPGPAPAARADGPRTGPDHQPP